MIRHRSDADVVLGCGSEAIPRSSVLVPEPQAGDHSRNHGEQSEEPADAKGHGLDCVNAVAVETDLAALDGESTDGDPTAVADRIRALGPGVRLISLSDFFGTNVAAYLDRPIYSAATGEPIRFVRYNEPTLFFMHSPPAAILRNARTLADASHDGAVVIADRRHHHLLAQLPGRWIGPDARLVVPVSEAASDPSARPG